MIWTDPLQTGPGFRRLVLVGQVMGQIVPWLLGTSRLNTRQPEQTRHNLFFVGNLKYLECDDPFGDLYFRGIPNFFPE